MADVVGRIKAARLMSAVAGEATGVTAIEDGEEAGVVGELTVGGPGWRVA